MLSQPASSPETTRLPWYAVKVRTRSEPIAVAALQSRGYHPFAPTIAERRRFCDRMGVVETPVFPGYLFCRLDAQNKIPVLRSPAVEYIVSFAGQLATIRDEEIEAVRRAVEAGGRPRSYLAVGQKVRVEYGSLAGLEGVLERNGKAHRIVVSVHLLQRSVAVEIDEDQICAIGPMQQIAATDSR